MSKIGSARNGRVLVTLVAFAALMAIQANADTFYVTNSTGAFSWSTTLNGGNGGVASTFTGPDASGTWTDAFALAVTGNSASGNIYVADAGTNKVYQFNKVVNGANTASFTTTPDTGDNFSPQEIALDLTGNLYTTSYTGSIDQYSGSTPSVLETLPGARGILINGSTIYVDQEGPYGSFTLDSFSTSGGAVTSHVYNSSNILCGAATCGQVRGMAIFGNTMYLADSTWTDGGGQIDAIDLTSFAITTFLVEGTKDLDDPNSLAINAGGNDLYVADYGSGQVSEYALTNGAFVAAWTVGGNPQGVILNGSQATGTGSNADPDFFVASPVTTPEPGTTPLVLLALGLAAAVGLRQRKAVSARA